MFFRKYWGKLTLPTLALLALVVGCTPASTTTRSADTANAPGGSGGLKRMSFAVIREQDFRPFSAGPHLVALPMLHSGLTVRGEGRVRHALLAEASPTLDNGLWKLLPDGRMETTWRLRPGARWHDGAPLTTDDITFSLQVGRDREMAGFNMAPYPMIEDVAAPDPATLTITWIGPFIGADSVLGEFQGGLLPKHILEETYRTEKANLVELPYWTSEFVGAGPFRLRQWSPGGTLSVEANPDYVLGRPKIDQIDVLLIPDANTLSANVLAGTVDVAGTITAFDLGVQLRNQWRDGRVIFNLGGDVWLSVYPQFVEPRPAVVGDVRFRRALTHAINRAEIAETLVAGMSPVAHTILSPNQPAYREIEAAVPKYESDTRRASELLEELGFRKGADAMYHDQANERLVVEMRAGPEEEHATAATTVANYWQRIGVSHTYHRITQQQWLDFEYTATFPAFISVGGANDVVALRNLFGSQARLPSNNYRVTGTGNRSRYISAEFDAQLNTYYSTVPVPARIQALGEIIHHMSDQLTIIGLYYNPRPAAVANRILNVSNEWASPYISWNVHEWAIRD